MTPLRSARRRRAAERPLRASAAHACVEARRGRRASDDDSERVSVNPLDLQDGAWPTLEGGYRVPVDIRPLLLELERATDPATAWSKLWQELYHQGNIGRASFAAIPHLVRIHEERGVADWNTYALAAAVELARATGRNPDVPPSFRST